MKLQTVVNNRIFAEVASRTGERIETDHPDHFDDESIMSHLARVSGLKLIYTINLISGFRSHLARVSGLKLLCDGLFTRSFRVASRTGERIETMQNLSKFLGKIVASRTGERIETRNQF